MYLAEIGKRLSDVFGAENILWVEGQTEEQCYPLIITGVLNLSLIGMFVFRILLDPSKNLTIAFSGSQLLLQCFGVNSLEIEKAMIERTGEMILAVFTIDGRPPLIKHAR